MSGHLQQGGNQFVSSSSGYTVQDNSAGNNATSTNLGAAYDGDGRALAGSDPANRGEEEFREPNPNLSNAFGFSARESGHGDYYR